jgi:hypothetical protein
MPPGSYPPPPGYVPPPAAESKGSSSKTLGWVLVGVGGAGVAVGSIFGGVALNMKSALDKPGVCSPKSNCNPTAQQDIDTMNTSATVSTVGFAVGGAALVTGIIVLVTSKSPATGEVKMGSVTPLVGPGSVGLRGAF